MLLDSSLLDFLLLSIQALVWIMLIFPLRSILDALVSDSRNIFHIITRESDKENPLTLIFDNRLFTSEKSSMMYSVGDENWSLILFLAGDKRGILWLDT